METVDINSKDFKKAYESRECVICDSDNLAYIQNDKGVFVLECLDCGTQIVEVSK